MILTGKAKQDFLIWYGTGDNYFNMTLQPIEKYANIIDWLDSVGIYISLSGYKPSPNIIVYESTLENKECHRWLGKFENRQSATEAAIKLANDLYNGNK